VFRSSKHIYAQVIDDLKGETLVAASSIEKDMRGQLKTGANVDAAKAVGKLVAERAAAKGIKDVVAKSLGSSNPYNMVRATFDALKRQDSPRSVAARRNIKVSTLQGRRRDTGEAEQAAD